MKIFPQSLTKILTAFTLFSSSAFLVHGQSADPNYVSYNSKLDVYRKPDVHHLVKAMTAQNELAMNKLAHLGMLQSPSRSPIPVRDSVNVALNKMTSGDLEGELNQPSFSKSQGTPAWMANLQQAVYGTPGSEMGSDQLFSDEYSGNLRMTQAKPWLKVSSNSLNQRLESEDSTKGFQKVERKEEDYINSIQELNSHSSDPQLEFSDEALLKKLGTMHTSSAKLKPSKAEEQIIGHYKRALSSGSTSKKLDYSRGNINSKVGNDYELPLEKAFVDENNIVQKSRKTLPKTRGFRKKVTERDAPNYREKIPTRKAIESKMLKIPNRSSKPVNRVQKRGEAGIKITTTRVGQDDVDRVGPKTFDSIPNTLNSRISGYKDLKFSDDSNSQLSVDELIEKVGSVDDNEEPKVSLTINNFNGKGSSASSWSNKSPLSSFVRGLFKRKRSNNENRMDLETDAKEKKASKSRTKTRKADKNKIQDKDEDEDDDDGLGFPKRLRRERKRLLVEENSKPKIQSRISDRTVTSLSIGANGPGYCPRRWRSQSNYCLRFSRHGESFRRAVVSCLKSDKVLYGPGARLITVGKLRKLLNVTNFSKYFRNRSYRINAIKTGDGYWREFPIGRRINFYGFSDFNPAWGRPGDTLIYLSRWNSLRVYNRHDTKHKALCYREKLGYPLTTRCFEPLSVECSDHGDCVSGSCVCDHGFSGATCAVNATVREGRDLLFFGEEESRNCLTSCGEGGGCDMTRGSCVCMTGTSFNEQTGACECDLTLQSGHCYHFGPPAQNYEAASRYCISKGLTMAEIHDAEEQRDIETLLKGMKNVWLGADNAGEKEDGFRWHSGLEVKTGDLGGWDANHNPDQVGCLALAGVIGHTWMTLDCNQRSCCGAMSIDTLCRVY